VLATGTTVQKAGPGFFAAELPALQQVKGKEKGVQTFRVTGSERTVVRDA
jgi:adenylate cyclase